MSKLALKLIATMLGKCVDENFTGSVQINFYKGTVTNINKSESFKVEALEIVEA